MNKIRKIQCFLLILFIFIAVLHCSSKKSKVKNDLIIRDYFGRLVSIPDNTDRILTLYYGEAEIICALGAKKKIVGVGHFPNNKEFTPSYILTEFMPEIDDLPKVWSGHALNLEKVMALNPQLVIADNRLKAINRLEALGIPTFAIFPQKFDDVFLSIKNIGRIIQYEQRSEKIIDLLSVLIQRVKAKTDSLPDNELVSLYYVRKDLLTTVNDTVHNEIFRISGGRNVVENSFLPAFSVKVSLENIYQWNPEVIIIRDRSHLNVSDIMNDPLLSNISAVKNKRVFKEHKCWIEFRLESAFGIAEKSKWMHPDLFADIDPDYEHQEFINLIREFNR
jgi:iron complex transport system substrate-binding protein